MKDIAVKPEPLSNAQEDVMFSRLMYMSGNVVTEVGLLLLVDRENKSLSDRQRECLVILAEECGELVHAICKTMRFGYHSNYENGTLAIDQLMIEMADVLVALEMKNDLEVISINKYVYIDILSAIETVYMELKVSKEDVTYLKDKKIAKLKKYTKYQDMHS